MMMKRILTLAVLALSLSGLASAKQRVMYVNDGRGNVTRQVVTDGMKITFGYEEDVDYSQPVDLGLSIKWASCNLGAELPEAFGGFYAWGETSPKTEFTLENYEYYDPYESDTNGYVAFKEISGTSRDAATVNLGGDWRMPKQSEWKELVEKCSWTFTTRNGVEGYEVTGPNGNSIFLPGAGNIWQKDHTHIGGGFYWTSTCAELDENHYYIYRGNFSSTDITYDGYDYPETGMTIRPVYGPATTQDILPVPSAGDPVDLGLSVKWSAFNLGGSAPGDYGNYYPWACLTCPEYITDDTYQYYDPSTDTWADIPDYSGNAKYDVATALWGDGWRTPTKEEFDELIANCDYNYESTGGHVGYRFTSRINGNSIFFPLGERVSVDGWGAIEQTRSRGYYWSSTPFEYTPDFAYFLSLRQVFSSDTLKPVVVDWLWKAQGYNVRPVKN